MLKINNLLAVVVIDLGLFILIGCTCYFCKTLWPLFLIFFTCTTSDNKDEKDKNNDNEKP